MFFDRSSAIRWVIGATQKNYTVYFRKNEKTARDHNVAEHSDNRSYMMKKLYRVAYFFMIGCLCCAAQEETDAKSQASTLAVTSTPWSLVYLPNIDWSEKEIKDTLAIINDLKPNMVLSLAPCSFADQIRALESKPQVLDSSERSKQGVNCGIPNNPHSAFVDTSTLHSIVAGQQETPSLVWLSSTEAREYQSYGPRRDSRERETLADYQIREQMSKRQGEVIFLLDTDASISDEKSWSVPWNNVLYKQTPTTMTGFTCIRPVTLQTQLPAIDGIAARVPVIHRIHSGPNGMEWAVLPIDGRPAIEHHAYAIPDKKNPSITPQIQCLGAPVAPSDVPLWMDDYVNHNPALETGETVRRGVMSRLFRWQNDIPDRDTFHILHADNHPATDPKLQLPELERGAVRSPNNLFSVTVGQLDKNGFYPEEGDDGINVYLHDRRINKSLHLYFEGLYGAWPSAATWFTDRYLITSGTASPVDDWNDDTAYASSTQMPTTLYLFDFQTGKAFSTHSYNHTQTRSTAPTERIYFPDESSYKTQESWKFLWSTIEAGYGIKPAEAPISIEEAIKAAQLSPNPSLRWNDLGIWPAPETWQLATRNELDLTTGQPKIFKNGGDPFLTYTETSRGQRQYRLAISSVNLGEICAYADLFTTGEGYMPQLKSVVRLGDREKFLLLAGSYTKPNSENGSWMLFLDQSQLRAWSAYW